jgi:DNA-binding transcriptional ArsR family regulator
MDAPNDALEQQPRVADYALAVPCIRNGSELVTVIDDGRLAAMLAALGHQVRLSLWRVLRPCGEEGLSAGTLASLLAIAPSSLSFHLRLMKEAGLLEQRRSSRHIMYAVKGNQGTILATWLMAIAKSAAPLSEQARCLTGDDQSQP